MPTIFGWTFTNFMSHKGSAALTVKPGTHLVTGLVDGSTRSNGAGKTAMFEALLWCLFGKTARGAAKDEIITKQERDVAVTITFSGGMSLTRTRKRGSADVLLKDGKPVSADEVSALGLPSMDVLTMTTFLFGGSARAFCSLEPAKQTEMIEELAGVLQLQEARARAKKRQTALKNSLAERERELANAVSRVQRYTEENEETRRKSEEWEQQQQKEAEPARRMALAAQQKAKDAQEMLAACRAYGERVQPLTAEIKLATAGIASMLAVENCPLCGSPVRGSATYKEALAIKREKLVELKKKVSDLDDEYGFTTASYAQTFAKLTKESSDAEREVRQNPMPWKNATNPFLEAIKQADRRLANDRYTIKEIKKVIAEDRANLKLVSFWVDGFQHLRMAAISHVTDYLSERIAAYASLLLPFDVRAVVDTTTMLKSGEARSSFSLSVDFGNGSNYRTGSDGERRAVDIACHFALQDIVSAVYGDLGLEVYDEPHYGLDQLGRDALIGLLRQRGKSRAVYFVTHSVDAQHRFTDVLTVVKKNGSSMVGEDHGEVDA